MFIRDCRVLDIFILKSRICTGTKSKQKRTAHAKVNEGLRYAIRIMASLCQKPKAKKKDCEFINNVGTYKINGLV